MKRGLLIGLALAVLLTALNPGVRASGNAEPATGATASGATKCSWEWKRKKQVKWVWRRGKKIRVVRYRLTRVRVCRQIPVPAPARLGVKAWEFGFTLSAKKLRAGDTIVELNNQGEDAHDLHIQRVGGGADLATPETEPGEQNRIRFTTSPGSYRLYCSLPNHASWGMDTSFEAD